MKKFLHQLGRKLNLGVRVASVLALMANLILPWFQAFATAWESWIYNWDYVWNEGTWNASHESGTLKVYYQNNPSEDLWNAKATPSARACNFNDKVYSALICDDSICSTSKNVELHTTWGETYQTVNYWENSYFLTMSAEVGSDDIYELYQQEALCTIPAGAPAGAYFPTNGGHSWAEEDWDCGYVVPFETICTIPAGAPAGAYFPKVIDEGVEHSWAERNYWCAYAVPFEATEGQCTIPADAPAGATITEYVATHPEEGCYYKLGAKATCTLPSDAPAGATITEYVATHPEEGCYYRLEAVHPQKVSSGKYVKLLSSSYSEDCQPTYQGWIANWAKAPWISIAFEQNFEWTIKFNYADYNEGADVYPRGEDAKSWGPDKKVWAVASIPETFWNDYLVNEGETTFKTEKFTISLVPATESDVECVGDLPDGAQIKEWAWTYTKTWNITNKDWEAQPEWTYNAEQCGFTCAEHYAWDGNSCELIQYNVTFVDKDETTVLKEATAYDYGTAAADIVKPADPADYVDGTDHRIYSFKAWNPEVVEVTEEATYTATYEAWDCDTGYKDIESICTKVEETYTLTLDVDGWTTKAQTSYTEVAYNAPIELPTDSEVIYKEWYTLDGWYDGEIKVDNTYNVTANKTLKAKWIANKHNITYKDWETELNKVENKDYWTEIEYYVPEKEGKVFMGWNPELPATMPDSNLEVNAIWEEIPAETQLNWADEGGAEYSIAIVDSIESENPQNATDNDKPQKTEEVKWTEVADSWKTATVLWWLDVKIMKKKEGEVSEVTNWSIQFKNAYKLRIPVNGKWISNWSSIRVKVKHNTWWFWLVWLANSAVACDEWKATADGYNGSALSVVCEWTKCYVEIYTCSASQFVAFTQENKSTPSGGSYSWGGGGSRSNTADDTKNTTTDTAKLDETKTDTDNDTDTKEENNDAAQTETYSDELVAAYKWAYGQWITTMPTIQKAKLNDSITREQLAKMMVQFMSKVLGKQPIKSDVPNYADVTVQSRWQEMYDYVTLAYQYQIMGIDANGNALKNFKPTGTVSRAEFATVLSRVLFGDTYNQNSGNYRELHIQALNTAGILNNTNPTITELRGWILLMLYRSRDVKIELKAKDTPVAEAPAEETTPAAQSDESKWEESEWTGAMIGMPNPASVYCEEQWGTLSIVKDAEWNESGICKLADGTEVEEWAYYRANHADEAASTQEAKPAEESSTSEETKSE